MDKFHINSVLQTLIESSNLNTLQALYFKLDEVSTLQRTVTINQHLLPVFNLIDITRLNSH